MTSESVLQAMDRAIRERLEASLAELMDLCRIPSTHANPAALRDAAAFIERALKRRGFQVRVFDPGTEPPVLVATRPGRSARTLLMYNHYDVQPPDPVDQWTSPPFEPTRRGDKIYARGISDDKGHLVSRFLALDALLAVLGELPVTVKFVIEGSEEGHHSEGLRALVERHPDWLQADGVLWEFGGVGPDDIPLQYLGTRGIAYLALRVRTMPRDVHSGVGGTLVPNAAWRLVWALASIKGPDERVRIPGFYDRVQPPSPRDLELLAQLPPVVEAYQRQFQPYLGFLRGVQDDLELKRMAVFEPSANIAGLTAGYQGPGTKTVLPAYAEAKLDFRLVPWQRPDEIPALVRAHLDAQGFHDVEVVDLGGTPPMKMDPDHPFVDLVVAAARDVYDKPMYKVPMRGVTGPGYLFVHRLGLPVATAGLGYPGSNIHAPDENIRIDLYEKAARHVARIAWRMGQGA